MSHLLTCILATKNRPDKAKKFRRNLEELKGRGAEIIVVDGSDEPYAKAILGDLADEVLERPDTSHPHALNRGIMLATERYVKLINDDDYFVPKGIDAAIEAMEEHQVDVLQAGGKRWLHEEMWDTETDPSPAHFDCLPDGFGFGKEPSDVLRVGASGVGQIIRRDVFSLIGLLGARWHIWDMEIVARAIELGANVKYGRFYTYEHMIRKSSLGLGSPKMRELGRTEMANMQAKYQFVPNGKVPSQWFSRDEAPYDGGFS